MGSRSILSMLRGPRQVRTRSATVFFFFFFDGKRLSTSSPRFQYLGGGDIVQLCLATVVALCVLLCVGVFSARAQVAKEGKERRERKKAREQKAGGCI